MPWIIHPNGVRELVNPTLEEQIAFARQWDEVPAPPQDEALEAKPAKKPEEPSDRCL